jgi:AMIN domain
VPPLFRSDPDENFSLWMQNCFPDASLAREDAIRQWLARPLEARVQRDHNHRAEGAKQMAASAPQEARDGARSSDTGTRNPKGWSGWNSQLIDGSEEDAFVDRFAFWTRDRSKLVLKFAKYSVLALLIVKVLWAIPTSKVASRADASIAATRPSKAEPAPAASVPVPQRYEAIGTASDFATGPITIENLSVGCEETQPCIEISTRGKAAIPRLSTLSHPDRVVMDFEDAVFPSDVHRISVGHGGVKAVRIGEDAAHPPRTRVVIDLTEKCDYDLHTLTNGVVVKVRCKAKPHQAG